MECIWSFQPIQSRQRSGGVPKLAQTDSTKDSIENVARAIYAHCKDLKNDTENYDTDQISWFHLYYTNQSAGVKIK